MSCVQQGTARRCVIAQQQISSQNRQRVLAIEVNAVVGNKAEGTLVLPFGLMLDAGVKLQVDDGATGPTIRYRTCLASGCLVPVNFDAAMLGGLRKATALKKSWPPPMAAPRHRFRSRCRALGPRSTTSSRSASDAMTRARAAASTLTLER